MLSVVGSLRFNWARSQWCDNSVAHNPTVRYGTVMYCTFIFPAVRSCNDVARTNRGLKSLPTRLQVKQRLSHRLSHQSHGPSPIGPVQEVHGD